MPGNVETGRGAQPGVQTLRGRSSGPVDLGIGREAPSRESLDEDRPDETFLDPDRVPPQGVEQLPQTSLRQAEVLERWWSTPLTARMLEDEHRRIVGATRDPERRYWTRWIAS